MVWSQHLRDSEAYPLEPGAPAVVRDQLLRGLGLDTLSIAEGALEEAMIVSQMSTEDINRLPHSERLNRVMRMMAGIDTAGAEFLEGLGDLGTTDIIVPETMLSGLSLRILDGVPLTSRSLRLREIEATYEESNLTEEDFDFDGNNDDRE